MSNLMNNVNQRTQLAGENRLELLLFRLQNGQLYGINVFKVTRIIPCPPLTQMPYRHPHVVGIATTAEGPLPVLDLLGAIKSGQLRNPKQQSVIVCEYNRRQQGFLVDKIEHIVNLQWSDIMLPPKGIGRNHYLTSITRVDNKIVEIVDVEKVIAEVTPTSETLSQAVADGFAEFSQAAVPRTVLVVDDSSVARNQIKRCLAEVHLDSVLLKDGREALNHLEGLLAAGKVPNDEYLMVISDIEMPEMDGYTFTRRAKENPQLKDMYILLHTSLSGVFNKSMVSRVGADNFIAKFDADDLAQTVLDLYRERSLANS